VQLVAWIVLGHGEPGDSAPTHVAAAREVAHTMFHKRRHSEVQPVPYPPVWRSHRRAISTPAKRVDAVLPHASMDCVRRLAADNRFAPAIRVGKGLSATLLSLVQLIVQLYTGALVSHQISVASVWNTSAILEANSGRALRAICFRPWEAVKLPWLLISLRTHGLWVLAMDQRHPWQMAMTIATGWPDSAAHR
jgi:hypothetical protein